MRIRELGDIRALRLIKRLLGTGLSEEQFNLFYQRLSEDDKLWKLEGMEFDNYI